MQLQALANQGQELFARGDPRGALRIFQQLHSVTPDHPRVNMMIGMCLASIAKHAQALPFLEKARLSLPTSPEVLTTLATTLRNLGRFDDAFAVLDALLAAHPAMGAGIAAKADLLYFINRADEAVALLEPALTASPRDPSLVLAYLRAANTPESRRRAAELAQAIQDDPSLPQRRRSLLFFRLGTVLDRLSRYDDAFTAFTQGHNLARQPWDPAEHSRTIDSIISAWTPEAFAALPRSSRTDETPVLIVGMPRSGTTLVEQIIDAHPRAFGAGELNDLHGMVFELVRGPYIPSPAGYKRQSMDRLADRYLSHLKELAPTAARITDKAPLNFRNLAFYGAMLPGARFIHCLRDPRDTCLSCYFQSIAGYFPQGHDLAHLGHFYNDHIRLMDHWKRLMPGRILDVRYEDVIDDQEGQTRRLLDFIGLEFDERCMRFWETGRVAATSSNDQVRQPLYKTSVARHERYAKYTGALNRALGIE